MSRFERSRWLRIIQTGPFLRKWLSLGMDEDDLIMLELEILKGPELHPIVKGTGGVRKIRFARAVPEEAKAVLSVSVLHTSRERAWFSC